MLNKQQMIIELFFFEIFILSLQKETSEFHENSFFTSITRIYCWVFVLRGGGPLCGGCEWPEIGGP